MAQQAWRDGTADCRHLADEVRISTETERQPKLDARPAVFHDRRLKAVEWRDLVGCASL